MRILGWATSLLLALCVGLLVYGLSHDNNHARVGSPMYPGDGPLPRGGGRYVVGDPYEVAGQWYSPAEQPRYDVIGIASWYGPQFHRRQTANGEWFDMDYLTAAHTTLPLPSYVRVTNLENGRELVVRVNDRGPFVGDRIIDLSRKAADILRMKNKGTARVRVKYIGPAPLNDDGTDLSAMNDASKNGPLMTEQPRAPSQASLLADASLVTGSLPVSSAPDGYAIQIGCFADQANAERTRSRVGSIGPVEVSRMFANSGTLFRVRIGPLTDLDQAKEALHQVIGAGYPDAQLMSWDGTL